MKMNFKRIILCILMIFFIVLALHYTKVLLKINEGYSQAEWRRQRDWHRNRGNREASRANREKARADNAEKNLSKEIIKTQEEKVKLDVSQQEVQALKEEINESKNNFMDTQGFGAISK